MADQKLKLLVSGPVPVFILIFSLLCALAMLSAAAQQSSNFSQYYSVLLVINVVSLSLLAVLIITNLYRLFVRYKSHYLGARLTLRLLAMFVVIAVLPISGVYYFSVQLINKGIDSWFNVQIDQALDDAVLLGRISLDATKQDLINKATNSAVHLAEAGDDFELIQMLEDLRDQTDLAEMSLYTQSGQVIASSSIFAERFIPDRPEPSILQKLRQGSIHSNLEPAENDGLQLRIVVPVISKDVSKPIRFLQTLHLLPLRHSKLGKSVESANREYKNLVYLREPLKFSFVLTLTLITLITTLIAVWLAIFSSRRLVSPLRDLAAGTRAVAEGNYDQKLPVTSGDEFGILVESFNNMMARIQVAQNQAKSSQQQSEAQKTYLETVLAHLSSGVLSFDIQHRLRTSNTTAQQILGVDIQGEVQKNITEIAIKHPEIKPLLKVILDAMVTDSPEWQTEASIDSKFGRRTLICRGTQLPGDSLHRGGYVVVFDDVTDLIQAQRAAAWGEVARRLAHEIKNPLTPIQLSAERIRHKFLDKIDAQDRPTLDRATRTIGQQVESLKSMVNAFSSYAQPVKMKPVSIDLKRFLTDIIDLHSYDKKMISVTLEVDSDVPSLTADPDRFQQVFNNLFINARDALSAVENPTVKLKVRSRRIAPESLIEIIFEDNGPGIPEALLDRLFEPYVTTKEKGTGLGLAIVKKIIEEHRGTIRAENSTAGGARLIIHLPADYHHINLTDPSIRLPKIIPIKENMQ